jgi:hypothetical protein
MIRKIHINWKKIKANLLMDEFVAQWPVLRGDQMGNGEYMNPRLRIQSHKDGTYTIRINHPIEESEALSLISAHNPLAESTRESWREKKFEARIRLQAVMGDTGNRPISRSHLAQAIKDLWLVATGHETL